MDEKENVLDAQERFTTEEDEPTLDAVDVSDLEANLHANTKTDTVPEPENNKEDNVGDAAAAAEPAAETPEATQAPNAIDWMFDDTMSYFNSMVTGVSYYPELLSVMQGGQAKVSLHRRYMLKAIDEKWVNMVEDALASLDVCIRNPRHYIEEIEEILPIELSRNISPRSVKHLAQHTDYISQIQGDEITPSKILNVFREDTIQTYENKFVNTLILRLFIFVNRRYEIALREGSDEKDTMLDFSNEFEHGDSKGKVSVHLELDEKPTPGEVVKNYTYTTEVWKRVEKLNNILLTYMNSKFVEDMGKSYIRPPVMRTNALMKNKDLHTLLVLWEFINSYEGAGYSMLVQDDLENVDAKYQSALYATTAMQYLVFRDSVEHGFANNETLDSHLTDKPVAPEIADKLPENTEVPAVVPPQGTPAEKAAQNADKHAPKSLRDPITDPAKYRPKKLNAFERTVSLALEIALETAEKIEELNPYVPPVDPEELAEQAAAAAAAQAEAEAAAKAEAEAAALAQKAEQTAESETTQPAETTETTGTTEISETDTVEPVDTEETIETADTADTADTVKTAEAVETVETVETAEITVETATETGTADETAVSDTAPANMETSEADGVHEQDAQTTEAPPAEPDRNEGLGDADFARDQKPMREVPDMSDETAAANKPVVAWAVDVDNDGDKDALVDTTGDGKPDTLVVNDGNGITADSLIDHTIEVPDAKVDESFKATIHWSGDAASKTDVVATVKRKLRFLRSLRRKKKDGNKRGTDQTNGGDSRE